MAAADEAIAYPWSCTSIRQCKGLLVLLNFQLSRTLSAQKGKFALFQLFFHAFFISAQKDCAPYAITLHSPWHSGKYQQNTGKQ